jgi:hypothetical protein
MNRRLFTAGLSAAALLAAAATVAPASATVIGGSSQSSQQGINASQGANAPSATGDVIVIGGAAPGPTPTQGSLNVESNGQAVGSPGGGDVFISPTGAGPTQLNEQGINGLQVSAGGAIGLQLSGNIEGNTQIVGGDLSCVLLPVCVSSVIIGSPTQANLQGVNSAQNADGGVTNGTSITTPTVIVNGLAGPTSQFSFNGLTSGQIVLG